jgi:hypothetical protein
MDRAHDGATAMTVDRVESDRRQRLIATGMIVAMSILALAVVVVELERWRNPRSRLFADPTFYSLADAIQADDVKGAYAFLRAGTNPNDLIEVRDPVLTRGRSVLASPLVWAVATEHRNSALMLLAHGARADRDIDKAAPCLADALRNAELATLLRKFANTLPPEQCPALDSAAPLLSLAGVRPQ